MGSLEVEQDPAKYPGFTGVCNPGPFTTMPTQPSVKKPGQLPIEKVKEYFDQGFTVVDGFFTSEELEPCRQSYGRLIDEIAHKLYKAGHVKNLYEDCNMSDRLIKLDKEWPGAVVLLLKASKLTPEFQALYQNERLLNAIEQLVGPEIAANPIWNTRPKAPQHRETDVPWHQDSAYFDLSSYSTLVATAWVAFVDAYKENGCMQFVKGGQKKGLVTVHECCDNFYLMIKEEELEKRLGADPEKDFILCPVKAGGVIFFSNMVPHRSVPNMSDHVRFAMDLRYQSPDKPWGYHGSAHGTLLRSPSKPDHVPDWDSFGNRHAIMHNEMEKKSGQDLGEFDITLPGPHMEAWEIVAHSLHTDQYFADKKKKEQAV